MSQQPVTVPFVSFRPMERELDKELPNSFLNSSISLLIGALIKEERFI